MTSLRLDGEEKRQSFFQGCVERMLLYWRDHQALASIDIVVLDRERQRILKNIALGLELQPLWPLVKPLVIAFAPYMERRGHWDAWHSVLEQAIRMAQRAGDIESETTLTAFLARVCQRMSRYDEVVRYYRRVIRLAKVTGNRFEEARACSNLGYYYIDGGRWWRSEVLSCHALVIFKELESDHGRAHTHNHLGVLYTRERQFHLADNHLRIACEIWIRIHDQHSLLRGYLNRSLLYIDMEKPREAQRILTESLLLAENTGDNAEIGTIQNNIGLAFISTSQYPEALEHLRIAEKIFLTSQNSRMRARVYQNIGLVHLHQHQWGKALSALEFALTEIQLTNDTEAEIKIRFDLAEYALQQNNTPFALIQLMEINRLSALINTETTQTYYLKQLTEFNDRVAIH